MSQMLQVECCCTGGAQYCPTPPCFECLPDSYVFTASGNGTVFLNGDFYSWSFQVRGNPRIVRYDIPFSVCAYGYSGSGGNNYDVTISGSGPFAGEYISIGLNILPVVFGCVFSQTQPIRSVVRVFANGGTIGAPRIFIQALGPYQPCPPGFQPSVIEGGIGYSSSANVLVENQIIESLEYSFT